MSIFNTIFGSGKVIEKGMELIDDAWETDAERLESRANAKISLMKAYAPFKVAQRYLALMFATVFLLCFVLVLVLTLFGMGKVDAVTQVMEQFKLGWIMTGIVMFYFGGGMAESINRRKKGDGE